MQLAAATQVVVALAAVVSIVTSLLWLYLDRRAKASEQELIALKHDEELAAMISKLLGADPTAGMAGYTVPDGYAAPISGWTNRTDGLTDG